jgi:hypothetical protein
VLEYLVNNHFEFIGGWDYLRTIFLWLKLMSLLYNPIWQTHILGKNCLYNKCLSPLMLWVWITTRARCTTLCDKVCQWLADNMKQPAAILVLPVLYTMLVLPVLYTMLVLPVFYQNLPVSAILVQILVNTSFPVSSRIFQYLQY